jgi:hypothetical protein
MHKAGNRKLKVKRKDEKKEGPQGHKNLKILLIQQAPQVQVLLVQLPAHQSPLRD